METSHISPMVRLKSRRARHPAYSYSLHLLEQTYEKSVKDYGLDHRPGALVFTAPSSFGKSTIIEDFYLRHPPYREKSELGEQMIIPVAKLRARTACTLKEYMAEICMTLGVEPGSSSNRTKLTRKILDGFKRAGTRMLITDETNVILNTQGNKERTHIRDFIKELIDETGIPIIFFGLPKCISFFESDAQTDARVEEYIQIPPFDGPTSATDPLVEVTKSFLRFLKNDCGIELNKEVKILDLSQRVYLASAGKMGGIQKIFTNLAEYAERNDINSVELSDFSSALKKPLLESRRMTRECPFTLDKRDIKSLIAKFPRPIAQP